MNITKDNTKKCVCVWGGGRERELEKDTLVEPTGNPLLTIPPATFDTDEDWVKDYIAQFGSEPIFF